MMRIIICFAIFLGCGYIGISFSEKFKKRERQIENMQVVLKRLEFGISFMDLSLAEAMKKASDRQNNTVEKLMYYISERLKNEISKPMEEIWLDAFEYYKDFLFFYTEDKEIILNLAENLGKGDLKTETDNINFVYSKLELKHKEALEKTAENEKLYRTIGFAAGAFIAIILL